MPTVSTIPSHRQQARRNRGVPNVGRHCWKMIRRSNSMGFMARILIQILLLFSQSLSIVRSFVVSHPSPSRTPLLQLLDRRCRPRTPARVRPTGGWVQQQPIITTRTKSPTALFSSTLKRVQKSITGQERTHEELKLGIAGFYDRSSRLWEDVWGEHMHHGYYVPVDRTDHKQAQVDLIDEVLKWAGTTKVTRVVDVGCGIGGSSRHIARKYGAKVEGITLSPYQATRGNELATQQGLDNQCRFQVADALDMPFDDNSFDLVWSLESGEHMPDKEKFVDELFRVATPGGRIIIVTWCHRDLGPGEKELTLAEKKLLRKINRAYYLPEWCSVGDYVDLLSAQGAVDVKREDWSYIIAPFWKAVIRSSLNMKSLWGLLRSGFTTQRGAYAMFLMLRGFNKGLIKFGLLTCTKPKE